MSLLDRINRVINTETFERTLGEEGKLLLEFQGEWPDARDFHSLPQCYQNAILAAEQELRHQGEVVLC